MKIYVGFKCRDCEADCEAEISITEPSEQRTFDDPGCGAIWHAIDDVVCEQCNEFHDSDWIETNAKINEKVQRTESEEFYEW